MCKYGLDKSGIGKGPVIFSCEVYYTVLHIPVASLNLRWGPALSPVVKT
jgi:hypothetical protein